MKKNQSRKDVAPIYFVKEGEIIQKNVKKGFWGIMDKSRDLGRFFKNRPFFAMALCTLSIPIISGIIGGAGILTPALLAFLPLISVFAIMSNTSGENSKFYNRRIEEVKQKIKEDLNYTKTEEKSLAIEKNLIALRKQAFDNIGNELFQKKLNFVDSRFQKLKDELRDIDRNILKTEVISILTYEKDFNIIKLENDVVKQKMLLYITKRINMLDEEMNVLGSLVNKLSVDLKSENKDFIIILDKATKTIDKIKDIHYYKISKNLQDDFDDINLNIQKVKTMYENLPYKNIDEDLVSIKELCIKINTYYDRLKKFRKTYLLEKLGVEQVFEINTKKNTVEKSSIKDKNDIRNYFNAI